MNRSVVFYPALLVILFFSACQSSASRNNAQNDPAGSAAPTAKPAARNPENREKPTEEPVATFREKTDDPLNDWYFTVNVYETAKTMDYRITMQFEELKGEDTLYLPDFGTPPKPVLKKGAEKYSCIVGFLDSENKFLEYKLVHVVDGNRLKLTTLKHYSVQ